MKQKLLNETNLRSDSFYNKLRNQTETQIDDYIATRKLKFVGLNWIFLEDEEKKKISPKKRQLLKKNINFTEPTEPSENYFPDSIKETKKSIFFPSPPKKIIGKRYNLPPQKSNSRYNLEYNDKDEHLSAYLPHKSNYTHDGMRTENTNFNLTSTDFTTDATILHNHKEHSHINETSRLFNFSVKGYGPDSKRKTSSTGAGTRRSMEKSYTLSPTNDTNRLSLTQYQTIKKSLKEKIANLSQNKHSGILDELKKSMQTNPESPLGNFVIGKEFESFKFKNNDKINQENSFIPILVYNPKSKYHTEDKKHQKQTINPNSSIE